MGHDDTPFWKRKALSEMTDREWESLCDGCGKCCLVKLEDADDSSKTYFTDVGCKLLDGETCRCTDYKHRTDKMKDCVRQARWPRRRRPRQSRRAKARAKLLSVSYGENPDAPLARR